ncbi:hypothetical protein CLOM_g14625 [Closterium sp. NIES-68]|nr:hypothetical protein CLOM_g14625 [Closterium sp. NIES-68]
MGTSVAAVISYYRNRWNEESEPEVRDMPYALIFAFVLPAARFILDKSVFEILARRFVRSKAIWKKDDSLTSDKGSPAAIDREALLKTHSKYKESLWKIAYYLSSCIFCFFVTFGEPWLTDTKYYWIGPGSKVWPDQMAKLKAKVLFGYFAGFYVYSIFAILFWETRRKDWLVHLIHHICCVTMSIVCYHFRVFRMAPAVIGLHDISDVLLEVAKLCLYSKFELGANVSFALFATTWVMFRLWWFPRNVLYSFCCESIKYWDLKRYPVLLPRLYYALNFATIMMIEMHCYWWILICRVLYRQLVAGRVEGDVRSDEEDDD